MGAVFIASHPTLDRKVIIKRLTFQDNVDFIERFRREASIMMDLRHENIVQVYDHFKQGENYHIVMEYIEGTTLEALIKEKRTLSPTAGLLVIHDVCKAIKHAHDQQVIHRDIKPANILISKEGVVKLVDFGVSASLIENDDDSLTKAGMTIGTPSYLAPEQISNADRKDKRADIYSIGVVLYEMLTGKKPYTGGFTPEVLTKIKKGRCKPARKLNPSIGFFLSRLIKKTMHHKVKRRFQDLGILLSKIRKYIKNFDSKQSIQDGIKEYIKGQEIGEVETAISKSSKSSSKIYRSFLALSVLASILVVSYYFALRFELHKEYIYPNEYGAFQIEVKLRKTDKKLSEHFVRVSLYSERDGKLKRMSDLSDILTESLKNETLSETSPAKLVSKKIFLKQNSYRIKLSVEDEQFQENFYLKPLTLLTEEGKNSHKVRFALRNKIEPLPLDVRFKVVDRASGKAIGPGVKASIRWKNVWLGWDEFTRYKQSDAQLLSGKPYKFQFKAKNYYTRNFVVRSRPEQVNLFFIVQLTPKEGVLKLRSTGDNFGSTLNNSHYFMTGKKVPTLETIDTISKDWNSYSLSPGEYFLTVTYNKHFFSRFSGTQKFQLKSGETIEVLVDKNKEKETINFEIK